MDHEPEVTFRNMPGLPAIRDVVRQEVEKLERYRKGIVDCRVAIERPLRFRRDGQGHRVRIAITGTHHPVVVAREPRDSDMHGDLRTIVLDAFKAARRQLQSLTQRQRGVIKTPREPRGLVVRLFPAADGQREGYGFLKTLDGRDVYFHEHSVLHADFQRLTVGTEVRFVEREGDDGPQASSVQVISKPGVRVPDSGPVAAAAPRGWEEAHTRRGRRRAKRGSGG